jgi:hypothetical protein
MSLACRDACAFRVRCSRELLAVRARQALVPQPAGAPMRTPVLAVFIVIGTPPFRSWDSHRGRADDAMQVGFV